MTDAGDARVDDAPEHIEPHRVADVDVEALVDALLDRNLRGSRFGVGGSAFALVVPEPAGNDALVALERGAIRNRVLARQGAAAAHVLVVLELHFASLHSHDASAENR